jgi:hypothetical protein
MSSPASALRTRSVSFAWVSVMPSSISLRKIIYVIWLLQIVQQLLSMARPSRMGNLTS